MPQDWSNYTRPAPPQIDPNLFKDDIRAKDSRATKADHFNAQFQKVLGAGTDYANYLTSEETARYNASNQTLMEGAKAFAKPSMNDQDIARMFSGYADRGAIDYSRNLGQLRTTLGGSGVTGGGWAGGQQGRYAAAMMASLTDATRTLYEKRIDADMHDRTERWLAQQAVAAGQAREPSAIGIDWISKALGSITDKRSVDVNESAARHAADATKSAGWMGLAGNAIGAIGAFA